MHGVAISRLILLNSLGKAAMILSWMGCEGGVITCIDRIFGESPVIEYRTMG